MEQKDNQIQAIVALAEYVTSKEILDKSEVIEIEKKLDQVLANLDNKNKFFKRLLS